MVAVIRRRGLAADLVVLDPTRVADVATLTDLYRGCVGIGHVFVNGVEVVTNGDGSDVHPGQIVHRR